MTGKKHSGFFITFEGPEGSGKSTHSLLLYDYLRKKGLPAVHTREPGGTELAEGLRQVLLNPKNKVLPLTELMLYEASRSQHTEELIRPSLEKGKIVICERYTDATLAYQGYGRGLDKKIIKTLNNIATAGLIPNLTIILDISVREGLKKARALKNRGDRLERENSKFHERVRQGYLKIARENPRRIKIIRTAPTINETHKKIIELVEKKLNENYWPRKNN